MCKPSYERQDFFARGQEKGWSEERIGRAWEAHKARRDAEELLAAPPPKPLAVGDKVNTKNSSHAPVYGGEILSIDGIEAWVRKPNGDRDTFALRSLERAS